MKWILKILPGGKEAAFASGLLLLYAAALFLSPDPEWTMWAAQMAIGVLYVPDAPTLQGIAPGETVRVLSAAGTVTGVIEPPHLRGGQSLIGPFGFQIVDSDAACRIHPRRPQMARNLR